MQMETFDISLWLVAVAAGKVVGTARNVIKAGENAALGRKRGYISNVCVSRPWRRKGVAAALLSGSMARLRAAGMEEARLGADSESLTGAPGLYGKMGFAVSNSYVSYRKGMPPC